MHRLLILIAALMATPSAQAFRGCAGCSSFTPFYVPWGGESTTCMGEWNAVVADPNSPTVDIVPVQCFGANGKMIEKTLVVPRTKMDELWKKRDGSGKFLIENMKQGDT